MHNTIPSSTDLPVLNAIVNALKNEAVCPFGDILFVCVQHLLDTTLSLLEAMVQLGSQPSNIHIMGKLYSSSQEVIDKIIVLGYQYHYSSQQKELATFKECFKRDMSRMWEEVCIELHHRQIKQIIILDDGGMCITSIPAELTQKYRVIGVEQTSSGLAHIARYQPCFPIIEVSSSAAKQVIESHMIADTVEYKLIPVLPFLKMKPAICAVIGLGAIGRAITQKLISLGYSVVVYDKVFNKGLHVPGVEQLNNIGDAVMVADYIFGCTGEDISEGIDFSRVTKDKIFISYSSQDIEFCSLLNLIQSVVGSDVVEIMGTIKYKLPNKALITVLNGGFPINFDRTSKSVGAHNIQLTRGLLLCGLVQAALSAFEDKFNSYMLHPQMQNYVVMNWLMAVSNKIIDSTTIDLFRDLEWIKQNSGGIYQDMLLIKNTFRYNA
jgi:S-adenosylhomocysteine hydrolase